MSGRVRQGGVCPLAPCRHNILPMPIWARWIGSCWNNAMPMEWCDIWMMLYGGTTRSRPFFGL